ncbi:hypothetical protein RHMOL_Rhmol04G0103400 [Rhododendron molle]|uniref:Uncharacterized protein n=1 Tax=Rhododendron molle TaxID=49168 RepID=A0ACC0NYT5_RHOML|nr:hypothetical protein RHMOL_Rhmol04G0103400 [Rhododendron molle]
MEIPLDFSTNYRKDDGPGSFMGFVDRVLLLHNSPNLTKFLLDSGFGDENPYRLNSWISTAIKRHVQELVLSIRLETIFELPRHLFTSIDLVVLKLSYGCCWSPLTVFLPRLKFLHLCYLEFLDDAPSLESLELRDSVSLDFEVDELLALVKADARVCFHHDDYEVVWMIAKGSHVRHLWLHNLTLKVVIHASAYNQLLFRSLTHLDIGIQDIPWSVVPELLGHIPSLTVLVLNKVSTFVEIFRDIFSFVSRIENVATCNKEMKLVRYLLENDMVLKKLILCSWSTNKKIKTDLQKYKRGSSTCQIEFCHQFSSVVWLYPTTPGLEEQSPPWYIRPLLLISHFACNSGMAVLQSAALALPASMLLGDLVFLFDGFCYIRFVFQFFLLDLIKGLCNGIAS